MTICRWFEHQWGPWLAGHQPEGRVIRTCTRCLARQFTRAEKDPRT